MVKEGWVATRNGFARRREGGLDIACSWFDTNQFLNAEIYLWRLQYKERRSAISGHGHLRNQGNAGRTFLPHHLVHCCTLSLCYLGAGSSQKSIKQYDHLVGPMTTDNLNNLNNLTNKVSYICYNFYACFNFYVSATKYEY